MLCRHRGWRFFMRTPARKEVEGLLFRRLKTAASKHRSVGVLSIGLLFITVLTAGAGIVHHNYELAHQSSLSDKKQATSSDTKTEKSSASTTEQSVLGQTSPQNPDSKPVSKSKSSTKPQVPASTQPATSAPATNTPNSPTASTVSTQLSVNGAAKGLVTIAANSNHCEVLSQALRNGQINSLDLRYSTQYGTYAVYMIDGVGDSNAVWWTYKVNGSSPPYGCSQMKVKNGDSVHWEYVKR